MVDRIISGFPCGLSGGKARDGSLSIANQESGIRR